MTNEEIDAYRQQALNYFSSLLSGSACPREDKIRAAEMILQNCYYQIEPITLEGDLKNEPADS